MFNLLINLISTIGGISIIIEAKEYMCSVIIPTYNAARYIKDTLESVINQTINENIEVIIIDDGSKDDTKNIITQYSEKYTNVKVYFNKQNLGVALTRNKGFDLAKGRYIALLDSDDIWETDKLERQIIFMQCNTCDICYTAYELIDENNQGLGKVCNVPKKIEYHELLKENVICCSSTLFKKEVVDNCKMDNTYAHEDLVFWISALQKHYKMMGLQEKLVQYRVAKGSRSNNKILAAKGRWIIYREFLNLSWNNSIYYFLAYAVNGMKKYYYKNIKIDIESNAEEMKI